MRFLQHAVVLILMLAMTACAAPRSAESQKVVTPQTEHRAFRSLQLENGMKVLLVSDPDSDKAGASLDVNVGSRQDPRDYQGLAHFLEHMLFLGTEAYPEAGDYQAFITANGGSHNAYTSFEHTNYFFDVRAEALAPALDRFAQFFVAPLFNAAYVQREVKAVESEYRARRRNDRRRELAVFKAQLAAEHPYNKFSVGNLQTLQAEREAQLREQLLAFYERYYSANIMSLTVVGRESLAELEEMVRARFSAVADRGLKIDAIAEPLFADDRLPRWVNIEPVQNERRLSLQFPVADARAFWRSKPLSYIGNLLGHEGAGSLLSELKARGWAEGLSAGQSLDLQGQAMFGVTIALTEGGLAQVDDIVGMVFAYVDMLRQQGAQAWRYREQSQLADQQFHFRSRATLTRELVAWSSALQQYPPAQVLRAPYLMAEYRPELIGQYLADLQPERAFITLMAPGLNTDRHLERYDVAWGLRELPSSLVEQWRGVPAGSLRLPAANPYIASDFDLHDDPEARLQPRRLVSDGVGELWLFNDQRFGLPKGRSYVLLESAQTAKDAASVASSALWLRMVADQLNEQAYAAQLAGLNYSVDSNWRGVEISLGGFNQTQAKLLSAVLQALRHGDWDEQRFDRIKRQRLRELENIRRKSPYQQLFDELPRLQRREEPALASLIAATESLTMAAVALQADRVLADFRYRILLHGNFTVEDAQNMAELAATVLPQAAEASRHAQHIVKLPPGAVVAEVAAEHSDAALLSYVQAAQPGKAERVAMGLAAQIISADFYHQLRTEKQLGYIVSAGVYPQRDVAGLFFLVQSPVVSAAQLAEEVDGYLRRWLAAGVDEATFSRYRETLLSKLSEQPENLWQAADRHWQDLLDGYRQFDSREQLIAALSAMDRERWWQIVEQALTAGQRRSMQLFSAGQWPAARPGGMSAAALKDAHSYQFD